MSRIVGHFRRLAKRYRDAQHFREYVRSPSGFVLARAVAAVVGKAADIKPLLAKFGTREEKKITDPDF